MKVLQMIDVLGFGGAQKVVEVFSREATRRGIDTTVVSLKEDDVRFQSSSHESFTPETMTDQLERAGAKVETFRARRLFEYKRIQSLLGFMKQERFDIIQTHLTYANILGAYTGKAVGIPVVSTLHSTSVERALYHPIRDSLETLALRFCARQVIAVGHAVAQSHQRRLGGKPVQVVPNAVPPSPVLSVEERTALRCELIDNPDQLLVIAVGRLVEPKAYPDLLDAFHLLQQSHPEAVLVIAGEGELRDELQTRIQEKQLTRTVRLLGSRADIPRLLAASDLYVISSHWEGLPMAVLEAMMAGLPVVATAVGDLPRVVNHDTGVLVPAGNPARLAEAISCFLTDPIRRRIAGVAAREHAMQNYSINAWFDRLLEVFLAASQRKATL